MKDLSPTTWCHNNDQYIWNEKKVQSQRGFRKSNEGFERAVSNSGVMKSMLNTKVRMHRKNLT